MTGEMNQQRFKALLKETITLLCSNGLNFRSEFTIEAVIGITIDQESILLVSMQDTVTSNSKSISSPQQISDSRSLQADRIENEFTSTSNGMLKPHTDTHGAKNNQDDKHIGDIAAEAIPVLRKGEDFEPIRFGECTDGLNIKAEQTEDSFEWKSDNCLSSSRESVRSKSNFASDAISLSCTEIHNLDHLRKKASVSKGVRHLFGQTLAVEKQEEDFPGVDSVSRTLNNDLDTNRTMQAYTVEETIGSITSVGHPESEMTALSSVDHILRNTIGLPRVRSVRKSNVIQNVSQDVQVSNFMQSYRTYSHLSLSWFLCNPFNF